MTQAHARTETFESKPCGRCGGSGRYSYNQMHGSRCFGCGGKGTVRTRRGAAAFAYLEELRSKRADAFVPGDLMRYEIYTPGGSARVFVNVTAVEAGTAIFVVNNERKTQASVTISGNHPKFGDIRYTVPADKLIRQGFDAETKRVQYEKALAYQATLTVKGDLRKDLQTAV